MRKVEFVYLHALLATVHEYLAERADVPDSFEEYDAAIGPYQVQRPKDEHEAAARLLASHLAAELSSAGRTDEESSADSADDSRTRTDGGLIPFRGATR